MNKTGNGLKSRFNGIVRWKHNTEGLYLYIPIKNNMYCNVITYHFIHWEFEEGLYGLIYNMITRRGI